MSPETTLEGLCSLKPHFSKEGFVTAGNASGIVDGAAALVLVNGKEAKRRNAKPLGRIVSWAYAGVESINHGNRPGTFHARGIEKGWTEIMTLIWWK